MRKGNNPGVAVLLNVLPSTLAPHEAGNDMVALQASRPLRVVWVGEGYPADVRRVLKDVTSRNEEPVDVITARRLSQGAIRLLEDHGISWADAAGYANVVIPPGVHVARLKPRPLGRVASTGMSWSPSTAAVAEYVLSRCARSRGSDSTHDVTVDRVTHIANATRLSPGQVAKVLVALDDEGYTEKLGPERGPTSQRRLRDPGRLLSDWAGSYRRVTSRQHQAQLHVASRDHNAWSTLLVERLASLTWAVSGWVAADTLAPFVTHLPDMTVYVRATAFQDALKLLTSHPDVSPVERGGRIHLRPAEKYVFEFVTKADQYRLVSPVRVYADLLQAGDRGIDAAEHLREVSIGL